MSVKRSLDSAIISLSYPQPTAPRDMELGTYAEDAKRHVNIEELMAPPRPNQLHQMEFDEERDFFLRVAGHLGVSDQHSIEDRLWAVLKFYSNTHSNNWCICQYVGIVPERDHNRDCPHGEALRLQRLQAEFQERFRRQQEERIRQHVDSARRLAALIEREWTPETAAYIGEAALRNILRNAKDELDHRHDLSSAQVIPNMSQSSP